MKKGFLSSKTIWTAAATFLTVLITGAVASPELAADLKELVAVGLPVVMVVLRMVTRDPIL